jgi:hypothetical protein
MADNNEQQKTYHKKASGLALNTVKKHSKENDLKLFGSCFWYVPQCDVNQHDHK